MTDDHLVALAKRCGTTTTQLIEAGQLQEAADWINEQIQPHLLVKGGKYGDFARRTHATYATYMELLALLPEPSNPPSMFVNHAKGWGIRQ